VPLFFGVLLVVAAVMLFEYTALRWGVDSRDDFLTAHR